MSERGTVYRFAGFELDASSSELRRGGGVVKLSPQPCRVLEALVRQCGEVVSRNDIREQVWSGDTFVDFDQGLNFCIRQIREALGDDADAPRFIETLPRRGYRFLLRVETDTSRTPAAPRRLIVLPFRMLRPDAETDFLTFSLPDAVTGSLSGLESLIVRSSLVASRFAAEAANPRTIAAEADVDLIVTGTLLRAGEQVRVSSQLTDASSGSLVWSHTSEVAMGDLFQVQDQLSQQIVESLSVPLTPRDRRVLGRDVPSSSKAYELFLRANRLGVDPKQWRVARDLYEQCVAQDPGYAPAWARLGRIRHVMANYLQTGTGEELNRAEEAFQRALALNPDLAVAHKLYAQFEVDQGRARDAIARLLGQAHRPDAEIFAGLVSTCRYCGLLDASVAADVRAHDLDASIASSVPHTWFLQRDYRRLADVRMHEFPYIVALALDALGRTEEATAGLRELEKTTWTRLRDFMIAARTLLEGDGVESLAAINRILESNFRDPEGLFYLCRHLAHLDETGLAIDLFERVVEGGYVCVPAVASDPWLDSLRKRPAFTKLLRRAEAEHERALAEFEHAGGVMALGRVRHRS
jgi:DNA-binding winged helix-turn-helix (wHTH) protein/tetratricopeptide (TPR) repeat protein